MLVVITIMFPSVVADAARGARRGVVSDDRAAIFIFSLEGRRREGRVEGEGGGRRELVTSTF